MCKYQTMKKTICGLLLLAATAVWADSLPRKEYPRPQFERSSWVNLNGTWSYCFDFGLSGVERGFAKSKGFEGAITVPFCPESKLSGIGHTDFINAMWYHRKLNVPMEWKGMHVMLRFGGVDFRSCIYINGKIVKEHFGGSSSFAIDIAPYVKFGQENDLVVYVRDDLRSDVQPSGKQSFKYNSYSCSYTRVTGIWQTVWMEPVARGGLKQVRITPDVDNAQLLFEPDFFEAHEAASFIVNVKAEGKLVGSRTVKASNNSSIVVPIKKPRLWSPESPFLYDVEFVVKDAQGKELDRVASYAGMRKVELRNGIFYLNNEPYFMRLVLDQGYYPDGIWTAPSDEALKHDIELGKEVGFNGARLHQKVFEQRYLYWADRLGYLTWGESASWGMDWTSQVAGRNLITEWEECIERDYNAPSIVAWSPLNETWKADVDEQRARLTNDLYFATKRMDRTRPVVSTSGGHHEGFTDIYAEHSYEQDPLKFLRQQTPKKDGSYYVHYPKFSVPCREGQAYIIDEYGGIGWFSKNDKEAAWGYGKGPKTIEELYTRLDGLTSVLLSLDHMIGYCYTQLTDVEQEKNGIYTYTRQPKFDAARLRAIFGKSREDAKKYVEEVVKAKK